MNRLPSDHLPAAPTMNRRDLLRLGAVGAGVLLGAPTLLAQTSKPARPKTNFEDALKAPRAKLAMPGAFPGRVVHVQDEAAVVDGKFDAKVVAEMFARGLQKLTDRDMADSFKLLLTKDDVVGLKVNPVGAGLISTRHEVVQAVIDWLVANGLPKKNIVIWDRFDFMLRDAGFTPERYPDVQIEALQTICLDAVDGDLDKDKRWRDNEGRHVSAKNFDPDVYYWADVEGPQDLPYLNQHVFCGKESYFGKLVTQRLTKIINLPVFKNTGDGVSMATKNLGYGAICNTNRLHGPLFFDVCTEVLAFPPIRNKLVLNVLDGLRAQYNGGPMPAAQFGYDYKSLFLATDPFAMDSVGHALLVQKRKEMGVKVSDHPMYTQYFRDAERYGLGVTDPKKVETLRA